ncbi:MAG: DUF6089 family protein [Schleiferiaceae bacterium]
MKRYILLILMFTLSISMRAQYYELGFGGGGSVFHGDVGAVALNAEGIRGILPNQPIGTITLRRQFNWHWSTRFNYSRGYLGSSDSWAKDDFKSNRGIDFRTEINEFALMTEFNFWPYATGSKKKQSFYIFGGIGLTGYNPQGVYDDQWVDLRPLGTEGQQTALSSQLFYGTTTLTVPMGMGFRRSLGRDISMTAEVGWRSYGSDYLDDTSGDYVDASDLAEERSTMAAYFANPGNVPYTSGLARGNANTKDWSIFAAVTLFYNLNPRNERCREF